MLPSWVLSIPGTKESEVTLPPCLSSALALNTDLLTGSDAPFLGHQHNLSSGAWSDYYFSPHPPTPYI